MANALQEALLQADEDRNAQVIADAESNPNTKLIPQNYKQEMAMSAPSDPKYLGDWATIHPKTTPDDLGTKPVYENGRVVGAAPNYPVVMNDSAGRSPGQPGYSGTYGVNGQPLKDFNDNVSFGAAPSISPVAPYKPPPAAPATQTDPLAAQLARASGGGKPAPFVNPYANQITAAEGLKQPLLNAQIGVSSAAAMRGQAAEDAAQENRDFAQREDTARAANDVEGANILAKHEALVKSEAARDFTKEYWGEKSTGQKIAGGIAAMLGGFLQGWNHLSSNPAIDQQNKEIERYIDEKKAKSSLRIGESKDAYSHFLAQTKDDASARALTHASLLQGYREKIEEAGAQAKDQQEMLNAASAAKQVDMQIAGWKDAAAMAQRKAIAGQTLTLPQLVELQSKLAEMNLKRSEAHLKEAQAGAAEAKAAGTAAPNETAVNAGRDLQRLTASNGGEVPGSGFVGRSLAGAANGEGFGASLARAVRGEDAQKADAAKYELAAQAMQAQNPKARFSPAQIADYMKREGFNGPPEVQREAIARAEKATRRKGPGAALQDEVAGEGTPAGFEEP